MNRLDGLTFEQRAIQLIDYFADRTGDDYTDRIGLFEVVARLIRIKQSELNERLEDVTARDDVKATIDSCLDVLGPYLDNPHGDMFWMLPMAAVQAAGRDLLPAETLDRMRKQWRSYTPYRGDTENHWLMYHASMLVMSELYPDDEAESWFNGRSSRENRDEAQGYLQHWYRVVLNTGLNEFDSPHYLPMYLAPLALIFSYSTSRSMRSEAKTMLDLFVADFAADSLNGLYVGAFSRVYPEPALERARNPSTTFASLLFGNIDFRPDAINIILKRTGYRPHAAAVLLAGSGYVPAADLRRIATDRSIPYVHRELKRSRPHLRYAENKYTEVFKYAYVCSDFAMGSAMTQPCAPGTELRHGAGLVQPIQQHTWELLWATGDPHDKFNLMFTLHPYSDAYEMGLSFPEEPRMMTKLVVTQEKPTYDSANKWTGGSPYEQVFQHESCIVALYCIPEGTRFPFISTFVSVALGAMTEFNGWLVGRVEDVFVAYFPMRPYEWRDEPAGNRRLHSVDLKNGCILQCGRQGAYDSLDAFCAALSVPDIKWDPVPSVSFTTLTSVQVTACYGEVPEVDGQHVDFASWPVFDGPFMTSPRGSGAVDILDGQKRRTIKLD